MPQPHTDLRWLSILAALTALTAVSIDLYLPAMPLVEQQFQLASGQISWSLSSFFIGLALGQFIYGPASDYFGRKPPLYWGLLLYIGATIGCSLSSNLPQLLLCRSLQALGACSGAVISRAIVRDRCDVQQASRSFSLLLLVMGLAPILAPLLGAWLLRYWHWRHLFHLQAGFGLVCLALTYYGLAESRPPSRQPWRLTPLWASYQQLLGNGPFLRFSLTAGLAQAGIFAYIAASPLLFLQVYQVSNTQYAWIFGSNALGYIAASQLNGPLLKRYQPEQILNLLLYVPLILSLVLVSLSFAGPLPLPLLLIGLFMFISSLGLLGPNTTACALAAADSAHIGTASALVGVIQFTCAGLSSSLVGLGFNANANSLVGLMFISSLSSFYWYRRKWPPTAS